MRGQAHGLPPHHPNSAKSERARQARTARQEAAHVEEANDLHDATREAVAHAPDHGAANPDEDGISEEGRPRAGGRTCEGQQDAAGDIERVVAQGVGSEVLGRDQVVGRRWRQLRPTNRGPELREMRSS